MAAHIENVLIYINVCYVDQFGKVLKHIFFNCIWALIVNLFFCPKFLSIKEDIFVNLNA